VAINIRLGASDLIYPI